MTIFNHDHIYQIYEEIGHIDTTAVISITITKNIETFECTHSEDDFLVSGFRDWRPQI